MPFCPFAIEIIFFYCKSHSASSFFGGADFFGGIVMIFAQKTIELKNGQTAVLKTPETEDAQMLLDCIRTTSGETPFLSRSAEDWSKTTVESEAKWIQNNRDSERDCVITCYIDGIAVGSCEISFLANPKSSHRAGLGISIMKKYWNLGIGSAMFRELMQIANEHEGCEIVELEFVEDNTKAQALYEKFGFRIMATKPNAFKLKDGTYQNVCYMQKYL